LAALTVEQIDHKKDNIVDEKKKNKKGGNNKNGRVKPGESSR